MTHKLEKALRSQSKTTAKRKQELGGTLGVNLNGVQVVEVSNRPGFVYVMLNTKEQELIQAFNDKVSAAFGLAVIVVWNVNRYEVLRKDDLRYGTWNSSFIPKHGHQHSFDPDNGGAGDVSLIFGKQFVPLSLAPSGTYGAPVAIVSQYSRQESGWHYVPDTVTPNIVNFKPTDNRAKMVLVCFDWQTGNPQVIIGTGSFSASLTGSADVIPYLPSTTGAYQIPIAGVRLVSGTSVVTWQNIYDVRQYFHPVFTGTSAGGSLNFTSDQAYYLSHDSDISTYWTIYNNQAGSSPLSFSVTLGSDVLAGTLVTQVNNPGATQITNSVLWLKCYAAYTPTTSPTTMNVYAKLYKRNSGGTETLLVTSSTQSVSTTPTLTQLSLPGTFAILTTDRLVIKIYTNTAGGSPSSILFLVSDSADGIGVSRFVTTTDLGSASNVVVDKEYLSARKESGNLVVEVLRDRLDKEYFALGEDVNQTLSKQVNIVPPASGEGAILAISTGDAYTADIEQTLESGDVATSPAFYLTRVPKTSATGVDSNWYAFEFYEEMPKVENAQGGFVIHEINNDVMLAFNPRAMHTGTAYLFNTETTIASSGTILDVRNKNVSKFHIAGDGSPYVNGNHLLDWNKQVTNGDSHDHNGGDGAQIDFLGLSNLPSAAVNTNDVYFANAVGASVFAGTINGAPVGDAVTYNVTSGNENVLVPNSTSQLGKLRLYNTTRGNYALISNCNTTTNVVTLTANAPANWQSGDTITIASQTVTGSGLNMVDIEITSGELLNKSLVSLYFAYSDTGGGGQVFVLHPFETYGAGKLKAIVTQSANGVAQEYSYKLVSNVITVAWGASGAATATLIVREAEYIK